MKTVPSTPVQTHPRGAHMNYTEYRKQLGLEPDQYEPGVTLLDFEFGPKRDHGGMATIFSLAGIPMLVAWYEWRPAEEYLLSEMGRLLGGDVTLAGIEYLGNGHWKALIRLNGKLHPGLEQKSTSIC